MIPRCFDELFELVKDGITKKMHIFKMQSQPN